MPQLTELQAQTDAMSAVVNLNQTAIGYGAKTAPMWNNYRDGQPIATFMFDEKPAGCVMDPWRLAIGAHRVERMTFTSNRGVLSAAERWNFSYANIAMEINVTYPVPVAAEAVAA